MSDQQKRGRDRPIPEESTPTPSENSWSEAFVSTGSTPMPSDPSSPRDTPSLDLASTIEEGSEMPQWPSSDNSRPVYRLALRSAGISLSEGFITQHPGLPKSVQKLMEPIACIPSSVKEMVSSR